jgi:hypothetical protein
MGNAKQLSYSGDLVREHAPDLFLLSLFVPGQAREALLALYALEVELAHVHHAVREEALGHIRYAWWEESVQAIGSGLPAREHPVLMALKPELIPYALPLVDSYRKHYPEYPPDHAAFVGKISRELIQSLYPSAQAGWQEAKNIIDTHRKQYGDKANLRLNLKLIWAGLF